MASANATCLICSALAALALSGCAKDTVQPDEVPALYAPVDHAEVADRCNAAEEEIAALDAGLGGPAVDVPPRLPATAGARWGSYGKNLVLQTIMGPLQPLIQTARAATNQEDKANLAADRQYRAATRRAYLMGILDGAGCSYGVTADADN